MADIDEILEDLKQRRDELRVQMNLASKEIRDEWEELEEKMEDFSNKARNFASDAKLKETGEDIGDSLVELGRDLKTGYRRIRDALRD